MSIEITKCIKIEKYEDIKRLVEITSKIEGDVTIKRGKYVIDGKSIMGILSIDFSQGVFIEYPENAAELTEFLRPFLVAFVEINERSRNK